MGYTTSGLFPITLTTGHQYTLYCDMETDDKAWTVSDQ